MSKVRTAMIVGGGVAGPVAAAALLRAGIEPTVYEAYSGPAEGIGGGLGLDPNGVRALAIIGADEAVRAVSVPMPHLVMSIGSRSRGEMPTLRDVEPLRAVERQRSAPGVARHRGRGRGPLRVQQAPRRRRRSTRTASRRSSPTAAPRPPTS